MALIGHPAPKSGQSQCTSHRELSKCRRLLVEHLCLTYRKRHKGQLCSELVSGQE